MVQHLVASHSLCLGLTFPNFLLMPSITSPLDQEHLVLILQFNKNRKILVLYPWLMEQM
jgi:hypothetical protein